METKNTSLQCYNRGCGQTYNPENNTEDSCRHHPGLPFFHDAYKGWSCCNKKCTDFTEFLNIKGCTVSKHSNEKPPEPEKPPVERLDASEVIEVRPKVAERLKRPAYETPLTTMKPEIAASLLETVKNFSKKGVDMKSEANELEIKLGTVCKNSGCSVSYEGADTDNTTCVYHPGVPIFHEGMKYWSCCQKKTSDFNAFLSQVGCQQGKHVWKKEEDESKSVQCRWDYHQTGSFVIVSIYAKQYDPNLSTVQLNPIRLFANIVFPDQGNSSFTLDLELRGIIKVEDSTVSMYGTKVELKLKKAEPGTWTSLEIPRKVDNEKTKQIKTEVEQLTPKVDLVDLDDL